MHILCSTDSNYIMPTGVMIRSICDNNSNENIVFHIIVDSTVLDVQKKQLHDVVKDDPSKTVVFYCFQNNLLNTFPRIGEVKGNYLTKAAYYRLFATEILPNNIDKIIYLDSDIIVDKSIKDLWNMDISNYAIGAVTDMSEKRHDYNRLGYDSDLGYFNSGVLYINLKYWRENKVVEKFGDIILNHNDKIKLHDQDILNIVFCKNKLYVPLKYNVQNGFLFKPEYQQLDYEKYKKEIDIAIANATIIHYTHDIKPWHKDCTNPMRQKWYKYSKKTIWKKFKSIRKYPIPIKTKIGNVLRKCHLRKSLYSTLYNPYIEIEITI